jgi:PAS domain S-box-containing protein
MKHDQRRLKKLEYNQMVMDNIKDYAIFTMNTKGEIVDWNVGVEHVLGYTETEFIGKPCDVIFTTRDIEQGAPEQEMSRARQAGRSEDERWHVRKDGSYFWGSGIMMTLRNKSQRLIGFSKIVRDRTSNKRATDALHLLQLLSATLSAPLDSEMTFSSIANLLTPRMADGCQLHLFQDGSITQVAIVHIDSAVQEQLRRLQALTSPDAAHFYPHVIKTGTSEMISPVAGTTITAASQMGLYWQRLLTLGLKSYLCVPLQAAGRVLGALTLFITEERRYFDALDVELAEDIGHRLGMAVANVELYQALELAVQYRDAFITTAAHELKNPIAGVVTLAEASIRVLDDANNVAKVQQNLDLMARTATNILALMDRLLDVSRITSQRLVLDKQRVDIVSIINGVVELVQATTQHHKIMVHTPTRIDAAVDPLRLEQVIYNLLTNAVRYTPPEKHIDIDLSTPTDELVSIAITDQGIGIPLENRQRLFERFYQVHKNGASQGLGLGLYISQQIIQLHGGQLVADFPTEGGTRMVITLPRNIAR